MKVDGHASPARRVWTRLLDGEQPWGALIVQPQRFGATRYQLIVYPPGTADVARRWIRIWRGWPLWGALSWLLLMVWLSNVVDPLSALTVATTAYPCAGAAARWMAGPGREGVRTMYAEVPAGHHDPSLQARVRAIEVRAVTMSAAYDRLRRGTMTAVDYEAIWWQVYRRSGFGLRDDDRIMHDRD
jgi:hypothetical protein